MTPGPAGRRAPETGVVLVNVLVVLALAATLVFVMLTAQERALDGLRRNAAATQAEALARGAEASVAAALRRDLAEAPDSDYPTEDWAAVTQKAVTLETGGFSVAVDDAQARYDLNRLAGRSIAELQVLSRLLTILDLPDRVGTTILAALSRAGRLSSMSDLAVAGLDPDTLATLAPHVDALPPGSGPMAVTGTAVNLNTASEPLLAALFANPAAARRLVQARTARGFVESDDLQRIGLTLPQGTGFTSDLWDAMITAEVDGVEVRLTSRIRRQRNLRPVRVSVMARRFGTPAPPAGDAAAPG